MPLAVPVHLLAEPQEGWAQAEENGTKYKVPGSEVEIDVRKTKNGISDTPLGTNVQSEGPEHVVLGHATPGESGASATTKKLERDIDDALTSAKGTRDSRSRDGGLSCLKQ
jgi:hypothetical protein